VLRRAIAAVAVLLVALAAVFAVDLYQPLHGEGHGRVAVTIPSGASTERIAQILARRGVIGSSFFFELRARLSGARLYAGRFTMPLGTTYARALALLAVPPQARGVLVTVVDGLSRAQLAPRLRDEGVRGSYLAASIRSPLLDPTAYGAPPRTPTLEGFLFPDTYELRPPVTASELVDQQLQTFKREFASVNLSWARAHHYTAYDVLIVASLAEAEAMRASDRSLVASVIYNRLRDHMDLGLDTTVAYATGDYSGSLTERELSSPSPWNTTNHPGLPPTPIDSPSLQAIRAAADPARSDYLYFIVKVCGEGSLAFTSSYAAFERLSQAYDAAYARRGLRGAEYCR
jgi:UPF0755 protein